MTQARIEGKFYPLQHQEWLRACRELTPAQRDVLYYIRTIDPHNNGIEINAAEIARQLSSPERQVHRQTVSRALKELDAKGFIDLELLQVKAKVKPKGLWCDETPEVREDTKGAMKHQGCNETPRCDEAPRSIATHLGGSPRTQVDRDAPSAIATHHAEAETVTQQAFQNSKINKTYLDFIQTLSESEREIFLEFGRKKAASLPHPPELPDKWIAANFTELYKYFLASSAGRAAKQEAIARKYDWENDPRLMDWLHKAYYEGHPWAVENEFEREERLSFLMWAQKTNAYAGRIADEPA
ncbi:MarR family transcriptional regulator [Chroococcidiopsis sp.]|uniref:MarR family transcriptional regulator n=1 Tax=Chroococcidiopsis sp. TaxID=3088168 RepID=UPI003F37BF5B